MPGLLVPKYTSYDIASVPGVQLKSAVVEILVAPWGGYGLPACPGSGGIVVAVSQ